MDRDKLRDGALSIGLTLSESQLDAFASFEERLYEANQVMNLTRVPKEESWLRHFLDSLLIHDLIPQSAAVLDVGSGPGFPAWPLACARPDIRVTALDSSGKMIGFLQRNPLPNLEAIQGRAESWARRDAFDVVTGRAVAPLSIQLELSAPACKLKGAVIPMRTVNEEESFANPAYAKLGLVLEKVERRPLPVTDIVRVFPVFCKTKRTPSSFPRNWAEIRKKPLA